MRLASCTTVLCKGTGLKLWLSLGTAQTPSRKSTAHLYESDDVELRHTVHLMRQPSQTQVYREEAIHTSKEALGGLTTGRRFGTLRLGVCITMSANLHCIAVHMLILETTGRAVLGGTSMRDAPNEASLSAQELSIIARNVTGSSAQLECLVGSSR